LFQSNQIGYKKWGKDVDEAQFYTHFFSLFYFVTTISNLLTHFEKWSNSEPMVISETILPVTVIWFWVIINVMTQYICIRGVYSLVGNVGALHTTLLLTLRKFFSLFFSVWYFGNVFYSGHWIGAFLVFTGCLWYQIYGVEPRPGAINSDVKLKKM
jgi:UDP-xylose/UDP-N-acetylglucosamine transporter B4